MVCFASGVHAQQAGPVPPQTDVPANEIEVPPSQEPVAMPPASIQAPAEICDNRRDDDGDTMDDCADADCIHNAHCASGGAPESNAAACSDWIDNDGDEAVDCDDDDCNRDDIPRCRGSWNQRSTPTDARQPTSNTLTPELNLPELREGMTVEELIGLGSDQDGERTDERCGDGVDNDSDGRTDCEDYGCRFDPQVTICQVQPGFRVGVVVGAGFTAEHTDRIARFPGDDGWQFDARITRVQLRLLGPIPFIQNSFFIVQMQAERQPRLQFIAFSIHLGKGHFLSINSGSGNLSPIRIVSAARQLLLDAPFFAINPFEQDNGAALELRGPITDENTLQYRLFAAAGSGNFTGNVGGRFFRVEDRNFSFAGGGQIQINLAGTYDRLDNPFLYVPAPLTCAILIGVRGDQRPAEQFLGTNLFFAFRWNRFLLNVENYSKREFAFGSWQNGLIAQAAFLVWPRHILIAADFSHLITSDYDRRPAFSEDYRQALDQWQVRGAVHWYLYRNVLLLSGVARYTKIARNLDRPTDPTEEIELRVETQFRF